MARAKLLPSEPMAVSAAMPRTMEQEKSNSLRRLVRLSRQAILHVHDVKRCRIRSRSLVFNDRARFEADAALRATGQFGIVRHQHQSRAGLGVEVEETIDYQAASFGIKISGRFIRKKNFGPIDKRSRHRHALLFAAGELRRIMRKPLAQAHATKQVDGRAGRAALAA